MKRIVASSQTLFLCGCVFLGSAANIEARIWTDVSGQHPFEADVLRVSADQTTVVFIGPNGKEFELPVEALSSKDQAFLAKSEGKPKAKKLTFADIPEEAEGRSASV